MRTLKQAYAQAFIHPNAKAKCLEFKKIIDVQTQLLSQVKYAPNYMSMRQTSPKLTDGLLTEPQLIDIPVAEFFVHDKVAECAKLFEVLQQIEKNLNQHDMTIMSVIRDLAANIVSKDYVDEMLKVGFAECCELRKDIVASNKKDYLLQIEMAQIAGIENHYRHDRAGILKKINDLIEQGANPQGCIEENWIDRYGALKTLNRRTDVYFKSAIAAVVWADNNDILELLLTHPKTKNRINLFKLLDQIVVHYYDQSQQSGFTIDDTDDQAKWQFELILEVSITDARQAVQLFNELVQKYTRVANEKIYCDHYIHLKLSIFFEEIIRRFGFDIGSHPELKEVWKNFKKLTNLLRADLYPGVNIYCRRNESNFPCTTAYENEQNYLFSEFIPLGPEYVKRKLNDPILVEPMLDYLDDSRFFFNFSMMHSSRQDFYEQLRTAKGRLKKYYYVDKKPKPDIIEIISRLDSALYYASGTFLLNKTAEINKLFQEIIKLDPQFMSIFFKELMKRMETKPEFKLSVAKWDKLVNCYITALNDEKSEFAAELKAFKHPSLRAQSSSSGVAFLSSKKEEIDDWVDLGSLKKQDHAAFCEPGEIHPPIASSSTSASTSSSSTADVHPPVELPPASQHPVGIPTVYSDVFALSRSPTVFQPVSNNNNEDDDNNVEQIAELDQMQVVDNGVAEFAPVVPTVEPQEESRAKELA